MNENNRQFKQLEDGATAIAFSSSMLKKKDFSELINQAFRGSGLSRLGEITWDSGRGRIPIGNDERRDAWFADGIECEVLQPNSSGWQKGKVRINVSLEFLPDPLEGQEPDPEASPLDWLRQSNS